MKWICTAAAPWALGIGLLISFTAEAGNTPQSGFSTLARGHMELITKGISIDQSEIVLRGQADNLMLDAANTVQTSLRLSDDRSDAQNGFVPLRDDLKQFHGAFPKVNRSAKKDSAANVPESLSRRALDLKNASVYGNLAFARDERTLPPTIVMPGSLDVQPSVLQTFQPDDEIEDDSIYLVATSSQSPVAAAAGSTGSGISVDMGDGSSPKVSRAIALSSTTPAPIDEMPMEIAAAPVSALGPNGQVNDRIPPNYSALVSATSWEREKKCLAEAVYFEARSEPPDGQAAVAQVVLNRVKSGLYPRTICGVVYQNRNRHLACQFTFACEGKALHTNEPVAWAQAQRIADSVLEGKTYLADVGGATHYHADYVRPYWAKRLKKMDVIGRHIFYKLRPGQT